MQKNGSRCPLHNGNVGATLGAEVGDVGIRVGVAVGAHALQYPGQVVRTEPPVVGSTWSHPSVKLISLAQMGGSSIP